MGTSPVCVECLTTFAKEGVQVCASCGRHREVRESFDAGGRAGYAQVLQDHGLVRHDDDEGSV